MHLGEIFAGELDVRRAVEPEFGGNHRPVTERGNGFTEEFFVGEWAVDFGCVEEGHATVVSSADHANGFCPVG